MKLATFLNTIRREADVLEGEKAKAKTYVSQKTFPNEQEALAAFSHSVEKLFDVNRWSDISSLTSNFTLYSCNGTPKTGHKPQVDDYIEVDLPGLGLASWVKVTQVIFAKQRAEFTVRPCKDPRPKAQSKSQIIKHFFKPEAFSTFRVEVQDRTVFAYEIGRNEKINNRGSQAGNWAIINTIIAVIGWAFFQKFQWKKLTDYLVNG